MGYRTVKELKKFLDNIPDDFKVWPNTDAIRAGVLVQKCCCEEIDENSIAYFDNDTPEWDKPHRAETPQVPR